MPDLNFGVLLILGIGTFGGILGAILFQRLHIPQVVGYITIGIIIGQSGLNLISREDILTLRSFNLFALGLIGFLVGGELHADTLRRYKKQFSTILLGEGMGAFILVAIVSSLVIWHFVGDLTSALAAGIVFGAIASATDPASTIDVLWEYRSRGVLTTTLTAIVALDDALAMTLYGLGMSAAQILTGYSVSISQTVSKVVIELGGAIVLGLLVGLLLNFILRWMYEQEKTIAIALGAILVAISFAAATNMDIILCTMMLGLTLTNIAPRRSKDLFSIVRSFSNPLYILFFVLVGARLGIKEMPPWLWVIIILYVITRSLGKMAGAFWGARLSKAPRVIHLYCGMGLLSQGGIAVGLSIMADQHLNNILVTSQLALGDLVIFGVTATTLIVQLVGPPMVKLAIKLGGEIDRNITEEDIAALWRAKDVMAPEALIISEKDPLSKVFRIFSEHVITSCPVADRNGRIVGIVSLEKLKDVLADQETWEWMVAADAMTPVTEKTYSSTPLKEALAIMEQLRFDRIPVVQSAQDDTAVGMLEMRRVKWLIGEEVIKRRRKLPTT